MIDGAIEKFKKKKREVQEKYNKDVEMYCNVEDMKRINKENFYVFTTDFDENGNQIVNCSTKFLKWLIREEHAGYKVIFHNGRGFDNHFLIEDLKDATKFSSAHIDLEPIVSGSKYLQFNIRLPGGFGAVQKITLDDSLNRIPSSIEKMPKMFNLKDDENTL